MARERSTSERIPRTRRSAFDAGRLGRRRHIVHALIQADITRTRLAMDAYESRTGLSPSFTAYIVHCVGAALRANPHAGAYLNWRRRLVLFEHVNVNTMIEVDCGGHLVPMPHVFSRVEGRDVSDLTEELRAVQRDPESAPGWPYITRFLSLPGPVRRGFAWIVMRVPTSFRTYSSPVLVTAVGMFGKGGGWGIPQPAQTLTVTVGGIEQRPGIVEGRIEPREYLDLTVSLDHDVVDGAPAARFVADLRGAIEEAAGLDA